MGYRGEDVSTPRGAWERQTPWPSSSDDYQAADSGGAGYGPGGGYPGQGQQGYAGYGQQDEQYGGPYGQQSYPDPYGQPYGQHDGYEPAGGDSAGGWGAGGHGGYPGYGQGDQGYERGASSAGYPQGGYDPASAPGYGPDGGYQGPDGGYPGPDGGYPGPDGGYPGPDGGYQGPAGGYQGPAGGYQGPQSGYQGPDGGGYPGPGGGYQDVSGGYGQPGGYPAQHQGDGYPAQQGGAGGYPAQDAGNDWYGGQPAAASGASFADTGAYRLNGRVIDEYGTGPRGALRDPVRGYPPGPAQQGMGQLPTSVIPAVSGPQALQRSGPQATQRSGPQALWRSGQQERYDDPGYPRYGQDGNGYPDPADRDAYGGYDEYATSTDLAGPGGYRGPGYEAPLPSVGLDRARDGFDEFQAPGDPYQDRYRDDGQPAGPRGPGWDGGRRTARGPFGGKRLLLAALAVVAVGIIGVAAYVFVLKPQSPASNPNAQGPLPTASAQASQQACTKELGTYCHIESRSDDPKALTTAELYPPVFTNETDKISYSLVSTKVDNTCSNAVIGPDLIKALQAGNCSQVLRASYVSGDGKIMGTIGVVNLTTTNEAHDAGKVVGKADFIAPLTAAKGVASKLGSGTGVVEAEYKGHYLILTWSEFVNETTPSTTAQDNQLEQFSNDLVAGSANIDLSQRMVTGAAPTPAAPTPAASASSSAKA
jgi:hypothetical protein